MIYYQQIIIQTYQHNMQPESIDKAQHYSIHTDYIFKFIIIGDTGVGKSCFLLQFVDNRFRLKHQPTIGVEFGSRTIKNQTSPNSKEERYVKLQIWDTAGQESFRSITRGYYRSAAGAILVYDITNKTSFQGLTHWLDEAKMTGNPEMSFLLVGNKADLSPERQVSYEEGAKFALENNMEFMETSAKTGFNIEQAFTKVCNTILERIDKGQIDLNKAPPGIKINTTKQSTFDSEVINKKLDGAKKKCC